MTHSAVPQVAIPLLGGLAILLIGSPTRRMRRWGYLVGLLSQPFWFWMLLETEQWGVMLLCGWYTLAYIRGIYTHRTGVQHD